MKNKRKYKNEKPINLDKYRGEWIALVNKKIVAHGKDFKDVAKKAKKISKSPVFQQIPTHDLMSL